MPTYQVKKSPMRSIGKGRREVEENILSSKNNRKKMLLHDGCGEVDVKTLRCIGCGKRPAATQVTKIRLSK